MTDDYLEKEMVIKEIDVKGIMTKSNLPVADFSDNILSTPDQCSQVSARHFVCGNLLNSGANALSVSPIHGLLFHFCFLEGFLFRGISF